MKRRESGSMLLEVIIALAVITVGLLGFFSAFMSNARASGELKEQDEVRVSLENLVERMRGDDFSTVYGKYNAIWLQVPTLQWYSGPAWAYVLFYVDENYIPSSFGPLTDIDGNPGSASADCSLTYKLLPTRILLYYTPRGDGDYRIHQLFLTLGPKT